MFLVAALTGIASPETPSLSLRHGVRVVLQPSTMVEQVLLAVGEQVGHGNISCASSMNKAVVVFMKEQEFGNQFIESGLYLNDDIYDMISKCLPSGSRCLGSQVEAC